MDNFSFANLFDQGKLKCDQWCYNNHGSERCPSSVDSADHAVARDFFKLKTLIDSVKQGTWKPGETLPTTQPAQIIPKPPTGVPKPQSPRVRILQIQSVVSAHAYVYLKFWCHKIIYQYIFV